MAIGEVRGGNEIVYQGEVLEILKTAGGRFSIYSPVMDKTFKSNIQDYDEAIRVLEEIEGTEEKGEDIALELKQRGFKGFSQVIHAPVKEKNYDLGETVPPGKPPILTYLGGGPAYEVWRSAKGRYTVTKRRPGEKPIDIKSSLTEPELQRILPMLPTPVSYQLVSPELIEPTEVRTTPLIKMAPEQRAIFESSMKEGRRERREFERQKRRIAEEYGE